MSEHALQVFLLGVSTRVTCRNISLNHSGGPYVVSSSASQCKFYGGPLCLQFVMYNRKLEEIIFLHTLKAYFNALMNFKKCINS